MIRWLAALPPLWVAYLCLAAVDEDRLDRPGTEALLWLAERSALLARRVNGLPPL